ncbi:MAG TPA: CocE/NonD family hydrolase [Solirubrobacteraceae bacterium]|nr:CocE/NonD family hydrolase [Solirubrobacteraceae bacterium]
MRLLAAALLAGLLLASTASAASAPDAGRPFEPRPLSKPLYGTQAETHRHVVEAADGVDLFVETWLPAPKDGNAPPARLPTILIMTPYVDAGQQRYTTRNLVNIVDWFTARGYAVSQHHVRGTYQSGGCLEQTADMQIDDAARVIEYLGRDAPWADGNVGMYGHSYDAETQVSVAGRGDPAKTRYLKAIVPSASVGGQYEYSHMDGVPYAGQAALSNGLYFADSFGSTTPGPVYAERAECVPEVMASSVTVTGDMTPYWRVREYRPGAPSFKAATLWVHGLMDRNVQAITVAGFFDRIPRTTPHKGLFGQWEHNYPDKHTVAPDWARQDFIPMVTAWYDRYLKGLDTGVEEWPPVQVQGTDGQWRAEAGFPQTGGPAGQLALGPDGTLGATGPSGSTSYTELAGEAVFTTPPVRAPLHVTGEPIADLWLVTDRPDGHVNVDIAVLGPDGEVLEHEGGGEHRSPGARSLMHLDPMPNGYFEQSSGKLAPTGTPIRVPVRFQPGDWFVPAGGRLRLTVSGVAVSGRDTTPSGVAATIELLHDCEHPSALRFLTARPKGPLLNVRETDEADAGRLRGNPAPRRVVDGDGLSSAEVCGERPERLASFGEPVRKVGRSRR